MCSCFLGLLSPVGAVSVLQKGDCCILGGFCSRVSLFGAQISGDKPRTDQQQLLSCAASSRTLQTHRNRDRAPCRVGRSVPVAFAGTCSTQSGAQSSIPNFCIIFRNGREKEMPTCVCIYTNCVFIQTLFSISAPLPCS